MNLICLTSSQWLLPHLQLLTCQWLLSNSYAVTFTHKQMQHSSTIDLIVEKFIILSGWGWWKWRGGKAWQQEREDAWLDGGKKRRESKSIHGMKGSCIGKGSNVVRGRGNNQAQTRTNQVDSSSIVNNWVGHRGQGFTLCQERKKSHRNIRFRRVR